MTCPKQSIFGRWEGNKKKNPTLWSFWMIYNRFFFSLSNFFAFYWRLTHKDLLSHCNVVFTRTARIDNCSINGQTVSSCQRFWRWGLFIESRYRCVWTLENPAYYISRPEASRNVWEIVVLWIQLGHAQQGRPPLVLSRSESIENERMFFFRSIFYHRFFFTWRLKKGVERRVLLLNGSFITPSRPLAVDLFFP